MLSFSRVISPMTLDYEIGKPQSPAHFAHFEFIKIPDGFDQSFETYVLREPAHVVMGFDELVLAVGARFDDVGKDRALCQKFDFAQFFRLFLEYSDKLLSYYLALFLGIFSLSRNLSSASTATRFIPN